MTKSQDTETPYIHDARLWLGSLGLLSSEVFISNENISRPLRDLSFGILCSLYSTEVVRARALTRMKKENKKALFSDEESQKVDLEKDPMIMGTSNKENTISHG